VSRADLWPAIEPLLSRVERPARYIDREWGALHDEAALYRACLIYPDTYEIGQANQALAILYAIINGLDDVSAERAYLPWMDMGAAMREGGVPLFSLESCSAVRDFDQVLHQHVPGLVRMIDLASLAGRQEIDATLLAVRTLNQDKVVRPLLYLGYRPWIQENLVRVSPENTVMGEFLNLATLDATRIQTTSIDTKQLADGALEHTITFSDGTSRIETSATPHLKVPMKEQIAAANQLQQLLPQDFQGFAFGFRPGRRPPEARA
jgi:hypothetical protein